MKLTFHHDGGNEHYHDEDDNGKVYSRQKGDRIIEERAALAEALEKFLETWDREFGYFDRQASKTRVHH